MGRNAAGESFLRAYLQHNNHLKKHIFLDDLRFLNSFNQASKIFNSSCDFEFITNTNISALSKAGSIFYPGPDISSFAKLRSFSGHSKWGVIGITHTTSSAGAMDSIVQLLTAPIYPWDALICTSNAVKSNVEKLLTYQYSFLKDHLGATKISQPNLPVIPLGIHCDDYTFTSDEILISRNSLQIKEDEIVVLYLGRLSFHAKAHPLAMYQALESASKLTPRKIVLIECGWHANDHIKKAFSDAAKLACPSIKVINLDGRSKDNRDLAWASADIFCSLSDNIQETFGITPIEAMARGIPLVVSDWDGYRDSVIDTEQGFLIPTYMPKAGLGSDLAIRHALNIDTYDMYCGYSSSMVAIDVTKTVNAFASLFNSEELRLKMGKSGTNRAKSIYDWSIVIDQYESLSSKLDEIRLNSNTTNLNNTYPARMDPYDIFSQYPTEIVDLDTIIGMADSKIDIAKKRFFDYKNLAMVNYAEYIFPSEKDLDLIFNYLSSSPMKVGELIECFSIEKRPFILRSLCWLIKLKLLILP
tara:strand:- start:1351 stop:2937 length:1587 start_codon:yes stop_codon:yes gene_type:complete